MVPDVEVRTYYDKAILKQPVWKWYVPAYFFTGGLRADRAVPAWPEGRHELPFVFAASAAASAGGVAVALAPPSEAGPARRVLVAGALVELASVEALHRRLGPELAETYEKGAAGRLGTLSKTLTAVGALTAVAGGRRFR